MTSAYWHVRRTFPIFLHPGPEAEEDQEKVSVESFETQASRKEAPIKEHFGEPVSDTPFQTLAKDLRLQHQKANAPPRVNVSGFVWVPVALNSLEEWL